MKKTVSYPSAIIKKLRLSRFRQTLFAAMFVMVLMLGARVFDVARQLAQGGPLPEIAPVMAETAPAEADAKKQDAAAHEKPAETGKPEAKADAKDATPADTKAEVKKEMPPAAASAPPSDTEDAALDEPDSFSDAEVNILKRLSERRQDLDKRGRELDQLEALLKVTEQRVDRKISDLKAMQDQIRKVLGDASDAQKAQEESMVKIYETMKAKDAAKIFENLDMPVLMSVVSRMKEARVAPILAAMDPVKAKNLTAALMEKKPLPPPP